MIIFVVKIYSCDYYFSACWFVRIKELLGKNVFLEQKLEPVFEQKFIFVEKREVEA